jgi:hypothetical protein
MRLLEPLAPREGAPLAHGHPLAKVAAAAVLMLGLFLTVDALTPALVLAAIAAAVPAIGIPAGALLRRATPLLVAAFGIAIFNAVLSGSALAGLAIGRRQHRSDGARRRIGPAPPRPAPLHRRSACGVPPAAPLRRRVGDAGAGATRARPRRCGRSARARDRFLFDDALAAGCRYPPRDAPGDCHGRPRLRGARMPHPRPTAANLGPRLVFGGRGFGDRRRRVRDEPRTGELALLSRALGRSPPSLMVLPADPSLG